MPFEGGLDFVGHFRLTFLYVADVHSLLEQLRTVQLASQVARKCVLHPSGSIKGQAMRAIDVSREMSEPFGVYPGQQIVHIRGPPIGQKSLVLGVSCGLLFRLVTGDRLATAYDCDVPRFRRDFQVKVLKWTRPKFLDLQIEASNTEYAHRRSRFRFLSNVGDVHLFDVRETSCRDVFGYGWGDRLTLTKADQPFLVGRNVTVIGVRDGALWRVDDGTSPAVAVVFQGCQNADDIQLMYAPRVIGWAPVKEFTA